MYFSALWLGLERSSSISQSNVSPGEPSARRACCDLQLDREIGPNFAEPPRPAVAVVGRCALQAGDHLSGGKLMSLSGELVAAATAHQPVGV